MNFDERQARELQHRLFRVASILLHDPWEAEDVSQEAISRLLQNIEQFDNPGGIDAWAYAVAVNLCRNRVRKKSPTSVDPEDLNRNRNPRRSPATSVILRESATIAASAVRRLPPTLREVFVLHYIESLPYEKVSEICGISVAAARVRAMRAREALQKELTHGERPAPTRDDESE
jgi:RNA polymerase sigma-70 factor (ECF subfamily)